MDQHTEKLLPRDYAWQLLQDCERPVLMKVPLTGHQEARTGSVIATVALLHSERLKSKRV